jgi:hypothetical protein
MGTERAPKPASLRRMPVPRSILTVLAAAFVLVTTAAPAFALSEDARDARGDVLSGPYATDDLPTKAEPARRVGDITRTKVALGADLVVTTTFRNLAAVGHQEFSWFIATSEDDFYWTASLVVQPGKDKGRFSLIDPIANQPGCGRAVLDRPGRSVTLTIPADCLGAPRWVRVANGATFFVGQSRIYYDDARRDAGVRHGWKYGPKVTAG